jgi:DNA polymerase-4
MTDSLTHTDSHPDTSGERRPPPASRSIVHLEVPDFLTRLEELREPGLAGKPLALAEPGGRATVRGLNAAARSEGIREGMPLAAARRMCRWLRVLPPDERFYNEQQERALDELGRFSPLVEGVRPGHFFVDLTGTRRLWGPAPDTSHRLERYLRERRQLPARVGLAANKLVSQMAARVVPPGDLSCVFAGGEAGFLAPLPVDALPGVGGKTRDKLEDFNIRRIGELAVLGPGALAAVFGSAGSKLIHLARGRDPSPVVPFRKTAQLQLVRTLDRDEIDRERLEGALFQQVEAAGWHLRRHNRLPEDWALEVRYADGMTFRHREPFAPAGEFLDRHLFRAVRPALREALRRRVAVRRLALEFSKLAMPLRQLHLFALDDPEQEREEELQTVVDGIRARFGRDAVFWGHTEVED